MAVQVNVTMAQPDGMDTLVWPCWASPCSGPPCCSPGQGGYEGGSNHVQRCYKAGTNVVQSRYRAGTKRYKGWYKPVQGRRRAATVNSSAPSARSLGTTRHSDRAERYLGVAVGATVAPGRVGAGVVGLSVGLSVVGVAVEGVAVLGTAVLHRTLTNLAQP